MQAAAQILSPDWHRVAALRPRLKPGLRIERHRVRGQRWQVLLDEPSGRSARLNPAAYAIAARLDGQCTLGQLWALMESQTPADRDPPSQDEFILTVRQLAQSRLVSFDELADFGALALGAPPSGLPDSQADATPTSPPWWSRLWAWRLPLVDPSPWLARCGPLARFVFSPAGLTLWMAAMLLMSVGLVLHGQRLWLEALTWLESPRLLWMAALVYPVMKAIHETSHALAVRRWEGRVPEAGITLMMLMPVPYVDASAASAFPRVSQRVAVSAAGIMAELALAAIGFGVWCLTDQGWLHDLGLVAWFLGGVSTVLFNANPLQRLDGYHVMSDACQLPNLAPRSRQWWQWRWQQWLSGTTLPPDEAHQGLALAPGERAWLVAYAPLAWLYMLGLGWVLGLSLGRVSAPLGLAVALVWAATWLVWPVARWLRQGWRSVLAASAQGGAGASAGARRLVSVVVLGLGLLVIPWPDATVVRGVVWPSEQALVRTAVDGFVDSLQVRDGDAVEPGQLLMTLRNPKLQADHDQRAAQLAQAEQDQFTAMGSDPGRAGQAGAEVTRLQADVERLNHQVDALAVRAGRGGRVALPHAHDLAGRYVRQGELLGHVLSAEPGSVKIAVREADAPDVGQVPGLPAAATPQSTAGLAPAPRQVSVRLASQGIGASLQGQLWRDAQGATEQLPTAALSVAMGGDILTAADDPDHRRALRPVVLMDIRLLADRTSGTPATLRLGERAWVRIDRGWSPPIAQLARWMRHQASDVFNPSR